MGHVIGTEEEEFAIRNRLLLSESVVTEVALAYMLYQQNVDQYILAKKVAESTARVADLDEKEFKAGKKSKLEALQSKIDYDLALNNAAKIYAELQSNLEQLNNSIGLPRYYSTFRAVPSDGQGKACCQNDLTRELNQTDEPGEISDENPPL